MITDIKIEQRKTLADYEYRVVTINSVIAEGENENKAAERLVKFVDWHLHKPERDQQYARFKALEEPTEAEQKWIAMYEERLAEMEKF